MRDFFPQVADATGAWFQELGLPPREDTDTALAVIAQGDGCDWPHLAALLNRGFAGIGDEATAARDLVVEMSGFPDLHVFHDGLAAVVSPESLLRLALSIGGRLNPLFDHEAERIAPGHWRVALFATKPLDPPCRAYFATTAETFRTLPSQLLHTEPCQVGLETDGRGCVLDVVLPQSRTFTSRVVRGWRAFWGDDPLLRLLQNEQAALLDSRRRLQEEQTRVDAEVRARTAELAQLNRELREASANKSRHLAEMSHELRTPLNAIIGYSELLSEEAVDVGADALVPDLEHIETSAKYLLRLVNNVLDLSKIEAGRLEVESRVLDLRAVVAETCTVLAPLVEEQGNTFAVELLDGEVMGDPLRVRQILTNLVSNAAKFTVGGSVAVRMAPDEGRWAIHVEDTGPGMDGPTLESVFQPYRQAPGSSGRGTGLGLSISRELAHLMDGTLVAVSTPGQGSRFTLHLPHPV